MNLKHLFVAILLTVVLPSYLLRAQDDSTTTLDAAYTRPFITNIGSSSTAIGGYLEGNTNYFAEDGISEGLSMELRRFNVFLFSTIGQRIRFLAELEFEHGTEEIALETAQLDLEIDPALVLRGGIVLVPIGANNVNHDSPRWEFIERPLVATEIIPSTLSEIGFGLNGNLAFDRWVLAYDAYLLNGLQNDVILNSEGRTWLQAGKSEELLAEDNNGEPAFSAKLALRQRDYGEVGLSFYRGVYNSFEREGEAIDDARSLSIFAIDVATEIEKARIHAEFAFNAIDIPANLDELYGDAQWGGYVEVTYPILESPLFGFENASLLAGLRLERIDYNVGSFAATGRNRGDEIDALAFSLSFRPSADAVIRANYSHHWITDLLGNPSIKRAGFQFGFASYF